MDVEVEPGFPMFTSGLSWQDGNILMKTSMVMGV